MDFKGVVVAAGPPSGSRPGPDRSAGATSLIANRPVVAHAVEILQRAGAHEVAIVGSTAALDEIRTSLHGEAAAQTLTFLPAAAQGDFVDLLAAAAPFVEGFPCLVHAANGVLERPLAELHELTGTDAPDLTLFLHHGAVTGEPVVEEVQRLLGVSELRRRHGFGIAGFGALGPRALRYAAMVNGSTPEARDLTAVAQRVAEAGGRVQLGRVRSWRQYAGRPQDLLEMNRIVLDALEGSSEPVEGEDNRIEGRVQIDSTAQVTGSVISGPVVVGPHARIVDAYVGPYTSIGAGAEVNGSEVERSIVGERARINHVGVRVQASTVGPDAQIFRDFGLPRAMRIHVGAGVEVALD